LGQGQRFREQSSFLETFLDPSQKQQQQQKPKWSIIFPEHKHMLNWGF